MEEKKLRMPRIGVIKHPKEGDWFEVPDEVVRILGEKPKQIQILLPYDRIEENYSESYQRHTGKITRCIGRDGIGRELVNLEDKTRKERTCPCDQLEKKQCHLIGAFNVLLPDVSLAGVYAIYTRGLNSRAIIQGTMQMLLKLKGHIDGIPLVMSRVGVMTGGNGHRRKTWILNLSPAGEIMALPQTDNVPSDETGNVPCPALDAEPTPEEAPENMPVEGLSDTPPAPMTMEQAASLNDLMIGKGLAKSEDRLKFFKYSIGEKEKTAEFAKNFIDSFDEFFTRWRSQSKT